jgi:predicted nuclease of restriction endonuclease-like (RecB) superfamily
MSHQPTRSNVPASLDFANLVTAIQSVDQQLKQQATRAVNAALTIRNWSIGYWIQEYEQYGTDRAGYGQRLLESLAAELGNVGVSRCEARELRRYRLFYQLYPQIWESLTPEFRNLLSGKTLSLKTPIRESLTPISGTHLIGSLSFTHICELLKCDSAAKREFYERECIEGTWSVRELRRQIASLYYERSELSINKQKLAEQTHASSDQRKPQLTVRDPYVFEFLGLRPQEVVSESHLESQLLDKLQAFLIELGQGFCFEARQRRILIGDTFYFVDLVFYHRLLKCHVLVDLKLEAFSHENIGQLNTYVTWYDRHVRAPDDNPPIGILLCTERDRALVQYALAGMDNELFVSKYELQLPDRETLQLELEAERRRLEQGE